MLDNTQDNSIMQIIQFMNDDRPFYEIATDVLNHLEERLGTSHAFAVKKNKVENKYEIALKCGDEELVGVYDRFIPVEKLLICTEEINYITDANGEYGEELALLGAKTCVSIPVPIGNNLYLYILLLDKGGKEFSEAERDYIYVASAVLQSIAQKNIFSKAVLSNNETLKDILANIGSGVMVFDIKRKNVLFKNLLAENSEEHVRVLADAMKSVMENDGLIPKRAVEFFDAASGVWFDVKFSKLKWLDEREVVLITSTDTTLKKKNSTRSTFQAQNDFLTGIFNRMKCETDLNKAIERAVEMDQNGALLFIDLDNFKTINDSLGHDYGDTLLKEIAIMLQGILGVHKHCYRMGGDEFLIIITPENYGMLERILRRLTDNFNKPWFLIDSEVYCTMSMGVVEFPKNGVDVNELIKKADIAMYEAKKSGKNRYMYYSETKEESSSYKRLELESNMRQAVEASCDEFVVFYQPIIDAKTRKCTGCESLVRWDSKALGFVGPGEFIPLAEYLGLIVEIGDFVLETACIQCKEWNDKYDPDFRINVNLSIVQLMQPDVVEHLREIIMSTGVNPANVTLEITENLAINDIERVTSIINGLKEIGVLIALDDFGTGYSSLSYIKSLEFDIIKVDKSFIDEVLKDDYETAFVKLIVDFARQLEVKTCAEGIESEEQYHKLRELHIDAMQGYHFGKPVPASMFEADFFVNKTE